jgi:ApaG protein
LEDFIGRPQGATSGVENLRYGSGMYATTTRHIRVSVSPEFLEAQSKPEEHRYFWAYTITVENHGDETVTLKSRYWKITDAMGRVQEVRGDGVVGEQPTLKPGEQFQYTSGCPLPTTHGMMVGRYQMISDKGEMFEIEVPAFSLDSPHDRHSVN